MKRPDDDYTYLEWVTGLRMSINFACDCEVRRISHDEKDERPREFINKLRSYLNSYERQIPDGF